MVNQSCQPSPNTGSNRTFAVATSAPLTTPPSVTKPDKLGQKNHSETVVEDVPMSQAQDIPLPDSPVTGRGSAVEDKAGNSTTAPPEDKLMDDGKASLKPI